MHESYMAKRDYFIDINGLPLGSLLIMVIVSTSTNTFALIVKGYLDRLIETIIF